MIENSAYFAIKALLWQVKVAIFQIYFEVGLQLCFVLLAARGVEGYQPADTLVLHFCATGR